MKSILQTFSGNGQEGLTTWIPSGTLDQWSGEIVCPALSVMRLTGDSFLGQQEHDTQIESLVKLPVKGINSLEPVYILAEDQLMAVWQFA